MSRVKQNKIRQIRKQSKTSLAKKVYANKLFINGAKMVFQSMIDLNFDLSTFVQQHAEETSIEELFGGK